MRWNLGLAGLATAWGLIAVLAAAVSLGAAPLAFWRLALAAITLAVVAVGGGRLRLVRPGGHLPALIALGVVQAAHWWLFFEAVKRGSVALAVLTFYCAPIFLAVLAPLFLPEKLSNVALGALIPGGIGAFEGVSILMLGLLKVPIEAGLAATLMLRAFILWLPMIPGFFILKQESKHLVEE